MWRLIGVVSLCALTACISPVMQFGGGKTRTQAQHDMISDLVPARLSMERVWTGPVATPTVRVYADDQYRAQNVDWHKSFDNTLDYANAVLGPTLGLKLVPDYRVWTHHASGATLEEHLEALAKVDAGEGALCVIGLTSSLGLVTATFDQI